MPSFDVVSEIDSHELTNAVDQANRELNQRFDFKDSGARYELDGFVVKLKAPAEFQLKQMLDILRLRTARRGIDASCLDPQEPVANLAEARQEVVMKHGIDQELGRKIQKLVKESGLRVQAGIQGDKVRISGKQRDDLQAAIALLRRSSLGLPLQFENFRD